MITMLFFLAVYIRSLVEMGIKNLLPKLTNASKRVTFEEMRGSVIAVDASMLLHRGAYGCAADLCCGNVTDSFVKYVMKWLDALKAHGIQPILVFDGIPLPAKKDVDDTRKRQCSKQNTITLLLLTRLMPKWLTWLEEVLFKARLEDGGGILIEQEKLHLCFEFPWTFEKFVWLCILLGCDYLKNINNVGFVAATKFLKATGDKDIFETLPYISVILKKSLQIPHNYGHQFRVALYTFKHQLIYDINNKYLAPVTAYPNGNDHRDYPQAGTKLSPSKVLEVAVGNIDTSNFKTVNSFTPSALLDPKSIFVTVERVDNMITWTLPCCPVITLHLRTVNIKTDCNAYKTVKGVMNAADIQVNLMSVPCKILCSAHCNVTINATNYVNLWQWKPCNDVTITGSVTTSESGNSILDRVASVSDSLGSLEISSQLSEDTDTEQNVEHSLQFKVLGVTKDNSRQSTLEEAFVRMEDNNENISVRLSPEPENAFDKDAIAVYINLDTEWKKLDT
ncbi:exonuclease 1-like isoform X3 [Ptychodera flava]|uniref:exonuclease 1-like isoform X3 n=1 Tax=Ptychodera flava TaxID=63121 RepID=UPI003969CBCE